MLYGKACNQDMWGLLAAQLTSVGLHSTNASVAGAKGGDERRYPNGLK